MRIITLIENDLLDTCDDLVAEWGLSVHIRFGDHDILFDTGASGAFADNAEKLGVDLSAVQMAVLSHHHWDHGGGLGRFFSLNSSAKVYLAKRPDGECYSVKEGVEERYIGLDKTFFSDYSHRLVTVRETCEILPNVFLFPQIIFNHPRPAGNKTLYVKKDGQFVHDDFSHELLMVIREQDGVVIFTGCAHSGLLNMVDTVKQYFPDLPIKAVIGGLHLSFSGEPGSMGFDERKKEIEDIGRAMLVYPVGITYSGHCTGVVPFGILQSVMGKDRLLAMNTGSQFSV